MPQDDTFVTPTTPTPTTPVQDDTTDQAWATPAPADTAPIGVLPIDVPATPAAPVVDASVPTATNPAPVDPVAMANDANPSPAADVAALPNPEVANPTPAIRPNDSELYAAVATKINDAKNVLVALSSDPSVDELSAAIGLTLYLDRIGKRATAIYSGSTPNALEFLKPEETFETTADTLQDFVIALNKEKADHLRYKLDGDYVKVYITPYRHRLSQEDLEFSYGDFNVDLVIALDVANGIDLDAALREHGRIMHDAVIVNATTGNPGKFGEIEWSDKTASSVSEMIATLLYTYGGEDPIAKDEATAYLTGIVAATNRFANAKTTPATMRLCSKLMESGANQQLVSQNITPDVDNELINLPSLPKVTDEEYDPTKLDIEHDYETKSKDQTDEPSKPSEVDTEVTKKEHTLLDDLKAAEQSLTEASAETVPDDNNAALQIDSNTTLDNSPELPSVSESLSHQSTVPDSSNKAIQDALDSLETPSEPSGAITSSPDDIDNPATSNAPSVQDTPEINGVPEMNFMPPADADILPPPPAPPVSLTPDSPTPESSQPDTDVMTAPLGPQPAMQDQVYRPQASDPSAFKIPGM